jgi:hypothetical protein
VNKSEESLRAASRPNLREKYAWVESHDHDVGGVLTGWPCLIPGDLLGTIGRAGGCIFCHPITLWPPRVIAWLISRGQISLRRIKLLKRAAPKVPGLMPRLHVR